MRSLKRLVRENVEDEPVESWLRRHGQSSRSIGRFWSPVLISALSETLDHMSLHAARKVVVAGLMASRRGYELEISRVPLAEIFDRRLGDWLESNGAKIHRGARVERVEGDSRCVRGLVISDLGTRARRAGLFGIAQSSPQEFDAVVLAIPWDRVGRVLSPELMATLPDVQRLEQISPAAITTVHLGYDRPITDLPHAMLIGRLSQWIFVKGNSQYQVVISASHRLVDVSREELADHIERELTEVFPAAAAAKVLHRRVTVQARAVFSAQPGIDCLRPAQATAVENLALAGDWTATGWPATMEGAVQSGTAAAEVILASLG